MVTAFEIHPARSTQLPIVISCPHVGTLIPDAILATMDRDVAEKTEDTDWFIDELYGFAPDMGITLIKAKYSRFVIDLNRDPSGKALYSDQRRQTALVPLTTFGGRTIYPEGTVTESEVNRRCGLYYHPYHAAVDGEVRRLRSQFPHVLFFDAHSIKRVVTSIRPDPFPDMIIGDNLQTTAAPSVTATALRSLRATGRYDIAHNDPFMGGFLTRKQGRPADGVHALQLEMSQDLYMNESDNSRNPSKQDETATVLQRMFEELAETLKGLSR
jgi:formiminoglutamase